MVCVNVDPASCQEIYLNHAYLTCINFSTLLTIRYFMIKFWVCFKQPWLLGLMQREKVAISKQDMLDQSPMLINADQ